jgi:L-iditol 2-dehydrogenase
MKAAVYYGKEDLRLEEIPVPEPGPGEMLLRVDACGICPTDLKKIQKGLLPGPRVFGHETAGTVAQLGRGTRRFAEGQRVVVHHHVPCGACFYCERKAYAQCPGYKRNGTSAGFEPAGGGYAEYVRVMDWVVERGVVPIPDGVLAEEASFVEPVNTCLKAVEKAAVRPGETVLVVGQGPIGLLLMQLARCAGATVVASDPLAERRALAAALGADATLDAAGEDVAEAVRSRTQGRGADCTLVAAGGGAAMNQAIAATRPAGRVLSFAATSPGETAEIDFGPLTTGEKDVLTTYSSSIDLQQRAAELVFSRAVRVRELVSHRVPIARAAEAFALALRPSPGTLKVVLEMGNGSGSAARGGSGAAATVGSPR